MKVTLDLNELSLLRQSVLGRIRRCEVMLNGELSFEMREDYENEIANLKKIYLEKLEGSCHIK